MYSYMSLELLQFPTVVSLVASNDIIAVVKVSFAQQKK